MGSGQLRSAYSANTLDTLLVYAEKTLQKDPSPSETLALRPFHFSGTIIMHIRIQAPTRELQ